MAQKRSVLASNGAKHPVSSYLACAARASSCLRESGEPRERLTLCKRKRKTDALD